MNRSEILTVSKPCLFNTEMVRAILDGRKTQTRRVVKRDTEAILHSPARKAHPDLPDAHFVNKLCVPRYQGGNTLYVRETWQKANCVYCKPTECADGYCPMFGNAEYVYKTDNNQSAIVKWCPSIHMPKEAARIFLRVTGVRAERLRDIECISTEGITMIPADNKRDPRYYFIKLWDSTIKRADLDRYGWNANPWVWVYDFERVICE